ncbi:MAG: aldehyde-activating protein [Myxococcaceae bacterium]|nr:aldehyde-activating protein [Myxococcaceae bacterium]
MNVQCRCGDVRLALGVKPIAQFYCHCDDCQVIHGGAYVPESVYPAASVTVIAGTPRAWTLKKNPRLSCGTCGTRLLIDVLALKLRGINGYLLPAGTFQPAFHMNCQFAVRPVVDSLPHYKLRPAMFGGSDETVSW